MDAEDTIDNTFQELKQLYSDIIDIVWDNKHVYHDSKGVITKTKPNHNIKAFKKCFSNKRCKDTLNYIASALRVYSSEVEYVEDYNLDIKDEMLICFSLLNTALKFMDGGNNLDSSQLTGKLTYYAIKVYYDMSCFITTSDLYGEHDVDELMKKPFENDNAFVNLSIKKFTYAIYERFLKVLFTHEKKHSTIDDIRVDLYKEFIDLIQITYFEDGLFCGIEDVIYEIRDKYPELALRPDEAKNEMIRKYHSLGEFFSSYAFAENEDEDNQNNLPYRLYLRSYLNESDMKGDIIHWILLDNLLRDDTLFTMINTTCCFFLHRYSNIPKSNNSKHNNIDISLFSLLSNSRIGSIIEQFENSSHNSFEDEDEK